MAEGLFRQMMKEAIEEVSAGNEGWKDIDTNTLLMACFGMLTNHLMHNITRPLWTAASFIGAGVVGYIIHLILG